MKKAVLLSRLSALALILAACQSPEVAANAQRFQSDGLQTYRVDGLSFQYPSDARVESAGTDEVRMAVIQKDVYALMMSTIRFD